MKLNYLFKLTLVVALLCPYLSKSQGSCYPSDPSEVLESTSQGTLYMDYNPKMPTFCLDYGTPAPPVGTIYDPVTTGVITYDNTTLSVSEIEERVSRTLSVINHPTMGVDPLPVSLNDNFYKAIQYVIWKWTDDQNQSSVSWTGRDGNTYTSIQLQNSVLNGDLSPGQVIWMIPQSGNYQPQVTFNTFSNADAGLDGQLTVCESEAINDNMLFSALEGTPDTGGTWAPAGDGSGDFIYTVNSTAPCTVSSTSRVSVTTTPAPDAGSDGFMTMEDGQILTESDLFNALEGSPDTGGRWSPSPSGAGIYTYSVTGQAPCDYDVTATVEVSLVLPVEWAHFDVEKYADDALLTWTTASEINNDYFEVQRSGENNSWRTIGMVNGSGTTFEVSNYSYVDKSPLPGNNYYRIMQVDYDGSEDFSEVRKLAFTNDSEEITFSVFPNPTTDYLSIKVNASVASGTILINDVNGKLTYHGRIQDRVDIDLTSHSNGIYIARIINDNGQLIDTHKIIKTNP